MSATVSALRRQLEELVPIPPVESRGLRTGNSALDELLPMRGLPRGKLTEIWGQRSSGLATVLRHVAFNVSHTRLVAYIDARRTLAAGDWLGIGDWGLEVGNAGRAKRSWESTNPQSLIPNPENLWIIRPRVPSDSHWCADVLVRSGAFALVVLDGAPPLSRSTSARLIRLARETGTVLVVAREIRRGETGAGVIGAAVRMTVTRRNGGKRESGSGNRSIDERSAGKRRSGLGARAGRHRQHRRARAGAGAGADARGWDAGRLIITIEKGGIRRGIEVEYAIGLEDRLCAHPEVGDRRGAKWVDGEVGKREGGSPGIGDWGLGIGTRSERSATIQSPIPNPQSPGSSLGLDPDRPRVRGGACAAGVASGDADGGARGDDGDRGACVMRGARGVLVG